MSIRVYTATAAYIRFVPVDIATAIPGAMRGFCRRARAHSYPARATAVNHGRGAGSGAVATMTPCMHMPAAHAWRPEVRAVSAAAALLAQMPAAGFFAQLQRVQSNRPIPISIATAGCMVNGLELL